MSAIERLTDRIGRATIGIGRDTEDLEAVARTLLGSIAEPGDGVMGHAVAALGPLAVADLLLGGADATALATALVDADAPLDPRSSRAALERWRPRIDADAVERAVRDAARVGARLLIPADPAWPVELDDLGVHAPLALWVRGDAGLPARSEPSIALVGARAATGYGEHVAVESAAGLSDRGFTVVSGGAYGIDGMAHRSTLRSGGRTVAFLAGGVDRLYPLGHESLLTRIIENGAVVSELPCGAAPTKWRFLQRNRLIAASSAATIVLEAGLRSGSLNTAGHAAALARPLGAVPGPVTSPASAGCHRLLREFDAVCVVDAEQMAELATGGAPVSGGRPGERGGPAPGGARGARRHPDEVRVIDALSARAPRTTDEVARRAGIEPRRALGLLGALEAEGRAARNPNGWVAVRSG
ncbi:DNA-processing protein DprA [Agromyces sp. LHK192]|uniref:DNA-processing protein DprA n=1 Tax=Agromyces sp. LHK192 TaxID=2498704 RepID=UPI000FDC3489|nr:DNA-processing protein DprA [Agromyces sp. LHK192]